MTPAELKTLREALGLSQAHLAHLAGVQERTVRHWEAGRNAAPPDVAAMLANIDASIDRQVQQALATARELIAQAGHAPDCIDLLRYRTDADLWAAHPDYAPLPVTTHAAMLARTRRALADLHVASRIVYAA
jgi:DNA-binding transcriptional regulator YiaG